jgi:hypothetical protein
MTIHPLAAAFTALLPAQWPIYDGQILDDKGTPYPADDLPTPPWIFLDFPEPDALERSLAGGVHAITIEGPLRRTRKHRRRAKAPDPLALRRRDHGEPSRD